MELPYRELIDILSVGLLKYYKTYVHIYKENFDFEVEIVRNLSNMIHNELKIRFPYMKEHIHSITLFEIPYEVECVEVDDLHSTHFGTEYIELLVKFIHMMNRINNDYNILSINVLPIDGFDITHGMIMEYFSSVYK